MRVKVTLAVGIALLAAVGALALTRSPPRVVGADASSERSILAHLSGDISVCQTGETLPADVSAIRLSMWAFLGWPMHVVAYQGSRVLTEGRRSADWTSNSVTVPVKPLDHATAGVALCFAIGPNSEPVLILGQSTPAPEAAVAVRGGAPGPGSEIEGRLPGRVGVEYLAAGQGSWWSRALSVASHMGLGRSFSGTWIAYLVAALMAAVGFLAVRLTLRELP
ncbi:MAG: hypothetical protein ACLPUT_15510 [Solirubrobacteraceae bacterium]